MTDLDRRTILRGAAISGAIGACPLLAACGSDGSSSATTETDALASTADIPVGGGKVFRDQEVVVTQPSKGEFVGYTAECTHQGCIVAEVSDGTINCPCHGSMFDIDDGSVVGGPAQEPLPMKPISVQGDQITLA
ncbi:MAG TPA: Rieske (2Fe-2S) protein [Nocardioidaceae bacterium]|nr:Rieske (2Fe-2S) protein [Nocardioidaceae bacterium]